MAEFLTQLSMDQIAEAHETRNGRPLMKLREPLVFQSDVLGKTITVPKDFVSDLASVPRIPLAWWLAGGHGNRASLVHDKLLDDNEVPRKVADQVFREALKASGAPGWRTWLMYAGVRIGAWWSPA
jgi:hypothetical protein